MLVAEEPALGLPWGFAVVSPYGDEGATVGNVGAGDSTGRTEGDRAGCGEESPDVAGRHTAAALGSRRAAPIAFLLGPQRHERVYNWEWRNSLFFVTVTFVTQKLFQYMLF